MSSTSPAAVSPVKESLALHGGRPAFGEAQGHVEPKVGVEEFLSLAERFGFSEAAMDRLRETISDADLTHPRGPHLGRYYGSANPSMGDRFEALAREHFGVPHAYAVANGTCALTSALRAVGAGPDTEVIVPGTGFIATAMAASNLGATPVFCDVDQSLQIDPARIEPLITPRTRAVVPTHHWGFVADMDPILEVAARHDLGVVEDCAQSPGASYKGRPVGTLGDLGCFSISSYKLIGGGEGGMVITRDERLFDRVRQAAEAGGLWREKRFAPPRYEGELFAGGNFRLSELESAVNVVQMRKLPRLVERFRHNWQRIFYQIHPVPRVTWQTSNDPQGDVGYMLRCFPESDALAHQLVEALKAEGVRCNYRGGADAKPDWHVSRYYYPLFGDAKVHESALACPVAAGLYDRCLSSAVDQWWNDADCDAVADAYNKVFAALGR